MDYTYPLPPKYLHPRYDRVFGAFKKGLSSTLIGLPQSSRSSYFKFILEYDPEFLSEFIDNNKFTFLVLEDENLSPRRLINTLSIKLLQSSLLSPGAKTELENRLRTSDDLLSLLGLEAALTSISRDHHLVIVLYQAEKMLTNPESIRTLQRLWGIFRHPPQSFIVFCFIGSPVLLEKKNQPLLSPLKLAIEENIIDFPLFDQAELDYTRSRLEFFSGQKISAPVHSLASTLSGGHYVLYKLLISLTLSELQLLSQTKNHPQIDSIVQMIWDSLTYLDKQNRPFSIPLLPPPVHSRETTLAGPSVPQLTAQQKLIFDYFQAHPHQVVSRDEIAGVIWGKLAAEKYSDWAIDRSISNLKKKLSGTPYQILTLRNRGYKISVHA